MENLDKVLERMRRFDFDGDAYDSSEVMNSFAEDVAHAVAEELKEPLSCLNDIVENGMLQCECDDNYPNEVCEPCKMYERIGNILEKFGFKPKRNDVSESIVGKLTLDEAIAHAREAGERLSKDCNTHECGLEHIQLALWLEELKKLREKKYASEILD